MKTTEVYVQRSDSDEQRPKCNAKLRSCRDITVNGKGRNAQPYKNTGMQLSFLHIQQNRHLRMTIHTFKTDARDEKLKDAVDELI